MNKKLPLCPSLSSPLLDALDGLRVAASLTTDGGGEDDGLRCLGIVAAFCSLSCQCV